MLGVLLAGLALAIGLTGLGDVDLEKTEVLASALSHVLLLPNMSGGGGELVFAIYIAPPLALLNPPKFLVEG